MEFESSLFEGMHYSCTILFLLILRDKCWKTRRDATATKRAPRFQGRSLLGVKVWLRWRRCHKTLSVISKLSPFPVSKADFGKSHSRPSSLILSRYKNIQGDFLNNGICNLVWWPTEQHQRLRNLLIWYLSHETISGVRVFVKKPIPGKPKCGRLLNFHYLPCCIYFNLNFTSE